MTYEQAYTRPRTRSYAATRPAEPEIAKMTWTEAARLFFAAKDAEFSNFRRVMRILQRVVLALPALFTLPITGIGDFFDWAVDFVPGPDVLSISLQALSVIGAYTLIRIIMIRRKFNKYYGV